MQSNDLLTHVIQTCLHVKHVYLTIFYVAIPTSNMIQSQNGGRKTMPLAHNETMVDLESYFCLNKQGNKYCFEKPEGSNYFLEM